MELVRTEADGKTGATLVSVFKSLLITELWKLIRLMALLVKDWNFPNDTTLENRYKQAKKGKL